MNIIDARYALAFLHCVNNTIQSNALRDLNRSVLEDSRFLQAPGGITKHHSYRHGLVQHVKEVMHNVCSMTNDRPSDELVTAVIWHDYMKVREYGLEEDMSEPSCEKVVKLPYRNFIRHVAGSAMEFHAYAVRVPLVQELTERIEHLLLSHHGRKEWGSPVEPATAEAFILHAADMMSATGVNL